ncbi:alpha/beta fold hydrolase [Desulfatitalea alkaliphila]|uniref:Alpha/beta hydrolase n=1 Tax=Desulfatitalea alkaliphila TaxID=2929485 RepID=A0AA41R4Y6_9BACT|nr:lysophospholipase [Desulfatitalea alkaliphila]MCJ8501831.1 alpha/beta hydrolase [Desulfatitalea alkaliphila]
MPNDVPSQNAATLVLLPGLHGTGNLFRPLTDRLPRDIPYQIVAYPTDQRLSIGGLACRVADRLPPGPVVVLAESFSGLVALELLAQKRHTIQGVIFCAAFARTPHPLLRGPVRRLTLPGRWLQLLPGPLLRAFALGRHADPRLTMSLRRALVEVAPAVLAQRLRLIAGADFRMDGSFAVPCHYLQAGRDRLVRPRSARWFAHHFVPFHLHRLDGPHLLLQARPRRCARLIASICRAWQS